MSAGGRGAAARWAVVGALIAVLTALPALIGALPVRDAAVPAAELRAAVLASGSVGFSGYAQSAGGLSLPVTDQLTSVADLLSDRTTMRVWWRSEEDARIDVVTPTGETGVHREPGHIWTWEYESATATWAHPRPLALPAPPDLLPSALARRLLSEADDAELSRLGAERVAGRDALGLRMVPAEPASSVASVDVWADAGSGLPLRVRVTAADGQVALDSRFLDVELVRPPAEVTRFRPPPGARVLEDRSYDVLEAAEGIGGAGLPLQLAGLDRRPLEGTPRAVAVYG
ncbi:MAG: transcriptional regulator, partial [Actinomycetota bacterium]|nr:transcriptional regulator [Actinomycetota bacterium]